MRRLIGGRIVMLRIQSGKPAAFYDLFTRTEQKSGYIFNPKVSYLVI
jgi:hypothetical protein